METIEDKIAALHAGKLKVCLVCTGAGAGTQNLIAQVPGASNTLLECLFPYSKESLSDFLGAEPEKFASEETAMKMAARAWRRGQELVVRQGGDVRDAVGVAVTAVIATSRPLHGEHRVYIAARTEEEFFISHVVFAKREDGLSALGRKREGELCDILTLNMLLRLAGIEPVIVPEDITFSPCQVENQLEIDEAKHCFIEEDGVIADLSSLDLDDHLLFAGSFNPLHFGHEKIAAEVESLTGKRVVYMITNSHPDKGGVGSKELLGRVAQFQYLAPVLVTNNLPLYLDKARTFPGFGFIIGADTLSRLIDPKYYTTTVGEMLGELQDLGVHFYVAGRHEGGEIMNLNTLRDTIPSPFWGLFTQLTTVIEVSSTTIRGTVS
jgi:nicotinamide mononucleotide (NMN) deamidase PncC